MRRNVFLITIATFLLGAFAVQYAANPSSVSAAAGPAAMRSALPTEAAAKTLLNTTPRHREWIRASAGSADVLAFIVYPERTDKAPIVVVTSNKGATDWVRAVGDQIAAEGYIAVVPDVLSGSTPEINAVHRHVLTLPSADGTSARIEFSSGITGDRIRADIASPVAGERTATFETTSGAWPEVMAFLNTQTGNNPAFGRNPSVPDDHSAHMMAPMAMPQASPAAPQAPGRGRGNQPLGYPQGKLPNLPAGNYTANSTLANSKLRKEFVDITAGNVKLHTWVEYPEGNGPAPIAIVMMHGLGLDNWMRALADQLALQGFIAIAPDLYSGLGPNGGNFDSFTGVDDVIRAGMSSGLGPGSGGEGLAEVMRRYKAARDWGMKLPRASGKSISIGFCAGGGHSFRFASEVPGLNAAVVFYGDAPSEETIANIKTPVLAFYGEDDARVTASAEPTAANMKKHGKSFEYYRYPHTTHGFLAYQNLGGNPEATADSWAKTTAFLNQHAK